MVIGIIQMEEKLKKFIFSTFKECFDFINPNITNYSDFSHVSSVIKAKTETNIQYNFDVEVDKIFKKQIREHNIEGKIFSEEGGWFKTGENEKYKIVYDPFCNSSLAAMGILDAAVGMSIFDENYNLITSAIMDYQNGLLGVIEESVKFYQIQTEENIKIDKAANKALDDSWVVIKLERENERSRLSEVDGVFKKAERVIIGSGHIYWLRLASGIVDAYLVPLKGQRLYEMFASTLAQKNGCMVTDKEGVEFDPKKFLKIFEKDIDYKYYPVAARNKELHMEIMKNLKNEN